MIFITSFNICYKIVFSSIVGSKIRHVQSNFMVKQWSNNGQTTDPDRNIRKSKFSYLNCDTQKSNSNTILQHVLACYNTSYHCYDPMLVMAHHQRANVAVYEIVKPSSDLVCEYWGSYSWKLDCSTVKVIFWSS